MKKRSISVLLVIFLYMMIYNPPIFPINCLLVLAIPSWIYLFFNIRLFKKNINVNKVIIAEVIIGMILAYCMLIALANSNSVLNFAHYFYWMIGDIPFAACVWVYIKKRGQGFDELLKNITMASLVMSITAILALVFPQVKELFTQRMIEYGVKYAEMLSVYRNYGFAANLTSFTSMLQASMAIICLQYALRGEKFYLLSFPSIAFSAVLNTRTSLLFLAVGVVVVFFFSLAKGKISSIFKFALFAIVISVMVGLGMGIIQEYNPQTFIWLNLGYEQISSFITGADTSLGYFGELEGMTVYSMPSGIDFVFGVGTSALGGLLKYNARSDVGFINDLWRGGLLCSAILILLFFNMLRQMLNSKILEQQDRLFIVVYFSIVFVLTNIKGSFFAHTDITVVFWLLYTALVFNADNNKINNRLIRRERYEYISINNHSRLQC